MDKSGRRRSLSTHSASIDSSALVDSCTAQDSSIAAPSGGKIAEPVSEVLVLSENWLLLQQALSQVICSFHDAPWQPVTAVLAVSKSHELKYVQEFL
jgi:hypothetical protein